MKMNLKEMKTLYTFGCPNREATVERLRYVAALTPDPAAKKLFYMLSVKLSDEKCDKWYRRLSKIKTKFLFGLTRRQCLFFGLGAAVGLPVFFLLRKSVSSTAASMLMMGVMLPFFMFGIYEKNGQPLETVLRQMVETKWLRPRRRPYETDNTYAALEREMRLRKEVKALEEQAKKARR